MSEGETSRSMWADELVWGGGVTESNRIPCLLTNCQISPTAARLPLEGSSFKTVFLSTDIFISAEAVSQTPYTHAGTRRYAQVRAEQRGAAAPQWPTRGATTRR